MKHGIFGIYFQLTVKRMSTKHSKHPPIPMMHLTGTCLREFFLFFLFGKDVCIPIAFLQDTLTQIITPSLSHTNYLSIQVDFDLLRCFVWFLQGIKGRPTGVKYCILTNIAFLIPLQTLWHLFIAEFQFLGHLWIGNFVLFAVVPKKRIYDELLLSDGRIATANRKRRLTARQAGKG